MVNDIKHIQSLLTHLSVIQKKYDEIAELTGENFNIFKVLKMEAREVRTHSAFLSELLNPKGSHGQGDTFLKLFINEVKEDTKQHGFGKDKLPFDPKFDLDNFQTSYAEAKVEIPIGLKTEEEGGRIDILIVSGKDKIIIENKIHAPDQERQLVRYYNYDQVCPLYYLTLWKHQKPTEKSSGHLKEGQDYKRISYELEIVHWLKKCREKAATHALLRETLTQYIYLIKYLTNQTLNKKMEKELIDLMLKKPENFQAYEQIRFLNIRGIVYYEKIELQLKLLAGRLGLSKLGDVEIEPGTKAKLFFFESKNFRENNICIGFSISETYIEFGYAKADFKKPITPELQDHLRLKMEEYFPNNGKLGHNLNWPAWKGTEIDFSMLSDMWKEVLSAYLEKVIDDLKNIMDGYRNYVTSQNQST
jgi:PD-(D/E)XK nuclease superfamily